MKTIDLAAVPNQSLSFHDGDNLWDLRFVTAGGVMAVDIHRNGEMVVLGQRVVADAPIIPYAYLSDQGNFVILSQGGELPWWEQFGVDQELMFVESAILFNPPTPNEYRPSRPKPGISPEFVDWWADIINRACRLGFNYGEL
ncbi:hypothetical protein B2_35 [Stenotrophomonas phage B2]|nr:hypothetical protein B2_35 [Stenotrophomonas phage B2]